AEDGIRDGHVTGVQTCALPIFGRIAEAPIKDSANCFTGRFISSVVYGAGAGRSSWHKRDVGKRSVETQILTLVLTCKFATTTLRSEERRVGKECRSRLSQEHIK